MKKIITFENIKDGKKEIKRLIIEDPENNKFTNHFDIHLELARVCTTAAFTTGLAITANPTIVNGIYRPDIWIAISVIVIAFSIIVIYNRITNKTEIK